MSKPRRKSWIGPAPERDRLPIANVLPELDRALLDLTPLPPVEPVVTVPLRETEDLREWHPVTPRPARKWSGARAAVVHEGFTTVPRMSFVSHRQVLVCVRRAQRREVLHALGRVGRGSGNKRLRRRNYNTTIRC